MAEAPPNGMDASDEAGARVGAGSSWPASEPVPSGILSASGWSEASRKDKSDDEEEGREGSSRPEASSGSVVVSVGGRALVARGGAGPVEESSGFVAVVFLGCSPGCDRRDATKRKREGDGWSLSRRLDGAERAT